MARKNTTKYAILGMLSFGPQSGYDIKQKIDASIRHIWNESYGQIYPILRRLTEEGLVHRETEAQEGRPNRHLYSLTPKGRKELVFWLAEPVESRPLVRNEALLKLFFGRASSPEVMAAHLRQFREETAATLQYFHEVEAYMNDPQTRQTMQTDCVYTHMTLRCGQHILRAYRDWCDETIKRLEELADDE